MRLLAFAMVSMALAASLCGQSNSAAGAPANAPASPATAPPTAKATVPDWETKAGGHMEFDVASVKQNKRDNPPEDSNFALGPGDAYGSVGGLFRATDTPAIEFIFFAYKVPINQAQELRKQLPSWATTDKFDIEARADGAPSKDQMRLMMQALLKERFNFSIHHEMRGAPVFALKVEKPGKFGPGLRPHPADATCAGQLPANGVGQVVPPSAPQADKQGFPAICGRWVPVPASTSGNIAFGARNVPMKLFEDSIGGFGQLDRPVLDQTGLTGLYDIKLEWTAGNAVSPGPAGGLASGTSGLSLFTALKEQMGLKLESEQRSVEELVVDHIDHPTPN